FRQADSSTGRRHSGLGIGLALVQRLAKLHGGTVAVKSEGRGKGSCFVVSIPLADEPQVGSENGTPVNRNGLNRMDVLVVDDSEDTVRVLRELLKTEGATVTTATGGNEALLIAAEKRFDVIISDISMPEIDVFEFLRRLRKIPGRANIPVLALTGFGQKEDIERAKRAGFFSHLTKPLDIDRLAQPLHRLPPRN